MKILHYGTLDVTAGGPAMSTYYTIIGLRHLGVDTELMMYNLCSGEQYIGKDLPIHLARKPLDRKFQFSHKLINEIRGLEVYDLYHIQGVWQYPNYIFAWYARSIKRPYIITPRGMLYPQDIRKSNFLFKKISLKIELLYDLNKASCVHATSIEEMSHLRNLGVTSPIAVISNPVEIKCYDSFRKEDDIFRIGYLGRLSPRKNIESLIYIVDQLNKEGINAELLIIGSGDIAYEKFLKSEVQRLRLKNVKMTGFVTGDDKNRALASLSILVLPSEFENFGNVIIESLIRKIPCIATKGAPWKELNEFKCGWWVDFDLDTMYKAIKEASKLSSQELQQMGERGRELVINNYSVQNVAEKMKALYEWIMNKQNPPTFLNIIENE